MVPLQLLGALSFTAFHAKRVTGSRALSLGRGQEDFFAVCLEFGPPPPQLKTNKQPKAGGKMSMKGASPCAEGSLEDLGASSSDRAIVGQGGLERVQHGDFGEDGNGRWRASLAESGKVGRCASWTFCGSVWRGVGGGKGPVVWFL